MVKKKHKLEEIIKLSDLNMNSISKSITCSGGVVYHVEKDNSITYLLLKHKNGNHWDLPKGHIEEGETYKETAFREIAEETGIKEKNIIFKKKLNHKNSYEYIQNNEIIKKTVNLFLFLSLSKTIVLSEEHSDYHWLHFEEISEKLTYQTSYPAFLEAKITIDSELC